LHLLDGQFVPQRRVLDAVLEHERIPACRKPVDARSHSQWTRIAVVAESRPDLFDAGANICGICKAATRNVYLIYIQRAAVDERAERLPTALALPRGNRDRRAVAEPDVPVDVVLPQRLLEPLGLVLGEGVRPSQGRAGVVDASRVDEQGRLADPLP